MAILTYDVVVENRGDGLIPAVTVRVDLPDGRAQRYAAGDLGARGLWRAVVTAAVGPSSPARVAATATAAAGDGTTAVSAPATTDVVAISAVTIERQRRRTLAAIRRLHRHPKVARRG